MLKYLFFTIGLWLSVLPSFAQSSSPTLEVILSTDRAARGDTIYADVIIRNGEAVAGADIGITTDECLRVIERQPGNYLPAAGENGGFTLFDELTESGTRLATSVTDRSRIANGDGTFFRAVIEVVCEEAVPNVSVSFAEVAALANPTTTSNELIGYSLEQGSLSVESGQLTVQVGAVASTPLPIAPIASPANTVIAQTNPLLYLAIVAVVVSGVGLMLLMIVYRHRSRR